MSEMNLKATIKGTNIESKEYKRLSFDTATKMNSFEQGKNHLMKKKLILGLLLIERGVSDMHILMLEEIKSRTSKLEFLISKATKKFRPFDLG
jgi:hypothetical protein